MNSRALAAKISSPTDSVKFTKDRKTNYLKRNGKEKIDNKRAITVRPKRIEVLQISAQLQDGIKVSNNSTLNEAVATEAKPKDKKQKSKLAKAIMNASDKHCSSIIGCKN